MVVRSAMGVRGVKYLIHGQVLMGIKHVNEILNGIKFMKKYLNITTFICICFNHAT